MSLEAFFQECMARIIRGDPPSLDEHVWREAEFLTSLREGAVTLPKDRLAELAVQCAETAGRYAEAAAQDLGGGRLTWMWLGGHEALRARVYAEAARAG